MSTDSGATYYGGVRLWSMTRGVLCLEFDVPASNVFGVSVIEVELRVAPEQIEKLAMGLRRVLCDATELGKGPPN